MKNANEIFILILSQLVNSILTNSFFSVMNRAEDEFPLKSSNKTPASAFESRQPLQTKEPFEIKKGVRLMDYSKCSNNLKGPQLSDFSLERSSDDQTSDSDSELDTEAAHYTTSTDVSFLTI